MSVPTTTTTTSRAQPSTPGTAPANQGAAAGPANGAAAGDFDVNGGGGGAATGTDDLEARTLLFRQRVLQGLGGDLSTIPDANVQGRTFYGEGRNASQKAGRKTVTQILNETARWSEPEIRAIQQQLWAGGYYGNSYYGDGEAEVQWGMFDQDTRAAFSYLLGDAVAYNRPLETILSDRARTFASTGQLARGSSVGPEPGRVGGGNVYQTSLTDPAGIRSMADEIARSVLGRKPTDDEKARYVGLIHGLERANQDPYNAALEQSDQARFAAGAAPVAPGAGGLVMPVSGGRMSENFGQDRGTHKHGGVDISAPGGSPIFAAAAGTVVRVMGKGDGNAAGNRVWITGTDGRTYGYFHMNDAGFDTVKVGDQVAAGTPIGKVGTTGRSSGNHLHFEVREGGISGTGVDPAPLLSGAGAPTGAAAGQPGANNTVDQIMAAIAKPESGGNYNARNTDSGAAGKYQIMPGNWPEWARAAGIGSNAPQTPQNQEIVARDRITRYLKQFGTAEAVAVAWYAGPGAAAEYVKNPDQTRFTRKQGNYPSIQQYVDLVTGGLSAPGAGNADTYIPATNLTTVDVDQRGALEEALRRDNPGEAGAHDIAIQYDAFRSILNRGAGMGSL